MHLILRGSTDSISYDGNLLLGSLCGAEVSIYSPQEYFSGYTDLFKYWETFYGKKGLVPYIIPTGASNAVGLWGYISASYELTNDFLKNSIQPEFVICATGSGGTQAGLSLGFAIQQSTTKVIGMAVCDSETYFANKVSQDITDWKQRFNPDDKSTCKIGQFLSVNTNDKYIGRGYALGYPEVFETIKWLAEQEGVILDPVYTGKAFYGLVTEIKKGSFKNTKNIVFVHTGGIFGLFPYREEFAQII